MLAPEGQSCSVYTVEVGFTLYTSVSQSGPYGPPVVREERPVVREGAGGPRVVPGVAGGPGRKVGS